MTVIIFEIDRGKSDMFIHKLTGKTSDHKDKLKDSQEEGGDK